MLIGEEKMKKEREGKRVSCSLLHCNCSNPFSVAKKKEGKT